MIFGFSFSIMMPYMHELSVCDKLFFNIFEALIRFSPWFCWLRLLQLLWMHAAKDIVEIQNVGSEFWYGGVQQGREQLMMEKWRLMRTNCWSLHWIDWRKRSFSIWKGMQFTLQKLIALRSFYLAQEFVFLNYDFVNGLIPTSP